MTSWRMGFPKDEHLIPMGELGQRRAVHGRREANTAVQVLVRAGTKLVGKKSLIFSGN